MQNRLPKSRRSCNPYADDIAIWLHTPTEVKRHPFSLHLLLELQRAGFALRAVTGGLIVYMPSLFGAADHG